VATPEDVKSRVASAYNAAADAYDHAANSFWERFGRRTVERLGPMRGARVLDLCCGSGASALPAAAAVGSAGQVVAVDLAEGLLGLGRAKAARLGLRNVEFRAADMLALDVAPCDLVVCVFGIFFVPDMVAALRRMAQCLQPSGRLAVTIWGQGLFEPVNTLFWETVRRVRPALYKSFNPWDRLGQPQAVRQLFAEAGLPEPEVVLEPGVHPVAGGDELLALLRGSGYRGVLEQLLPAEREQVQDEVLGACRARSVTSVGVDVIYAVGRPGELRDAGRASSW